MMTTTSEASQMTQPTDEPTATAEQFDAYRAMFRHFNRALFGGSLPEPLLNLSRGPQRAVAFFAPNRWKNNATAAKTTHEISLNPRHLLDGSARDTAQNLVHEMVHLWQQVHGTPPRRGYHDREWSTKMVEVGLQPIDVKTGKPSMSAHGMSDNVIDGGAFARAFDALPADALLPWSCVEARPTPAPAPTGQGGANGAEGDEPADAPPKPRNKVKYTCPSCAANVWGKPGLMIACVGGHDPALFVPVA